MLVSEGHVATRALQIGNACTITWGYSEVWPKLWLRAISGYLTLLKEWSVLVSLATVTSISLCLSKILATT